MAPCRTDSDSVSREFKSLHPSHLRAKSGKNCLIQPVFSCFSGIFGGFELSVIGKWEVNWEVFGK